MGEETIMGCAYLSLTAILNDTVALPCDILPLLVLGSTWSILPHSVPIYTNGLNEFVFSLWWLHEKINKCIVLFNVNVSLYPYYVALVSVRRGLCACARGTPV